MKSSSLVKKVAVWRLISVLVTLLVLYVATGDVKSATGITVFLHIITTICHYMFEKCWGELYDK